MSGISKAVGSRLMRFLLVEAANIAVRFDPDFRKEYSHRCHQKHFIVAKVAAARKLAIRMYWILWTQTPYPQVLSSRAAWKCILAEVSETDRLSRRPRTR